MKKRAHHRSHHRKVARLRDNDTYLVVVRSWMLVVMFALMLGIGAVVGNFINQRLNEASPQVAGAQIAR